MMDTTASFVALVGRNEATSTSPRTISQSAATTESLAMVTSRSLPQQVFGYQVVARPVPLRHQQEKTFISAHIKANLGSGAVPQIPAAWFDREYRTFFAEAAVEQDIAWQIKANRQYRKLSQAELAKMIGSKQSSISRLEDPEYGKHSIDMLKKLASAFDCALQVKLVSYSQLHRDSEDLSMEALVALPFEEEFANQTSMDEND